MNLQLFDKVVLISGGAKGIGAATAHALVQEGAVLAIVDRDAEAGEELTELRRAGARSLVICTDLTSSENDNQYCAIPRFEQIDKPSEFASPHQTGLLRNFCAQQVFPLAIQGIK